MIKPTVTLLCNFIEDKRTSMQVYADNLGHALSDTASDLEVHTYRPRVRYLKPGTNDLWPMRLDRYLDYPKQVSVIRDTNLVCLYRSD